jgi:predicted nuclease of predicted toxin-antitoxin system
VIALLLDAGLPRGTAADLRADGWDVQHVADTGLGAAKDEEILSAAARDGRAIVTLDHDFSHLLYLSAAVVPSVILVRIDGLDRPGAAKLLRAVVPRVDADLRAGAIVSVDWSGVRIRPLPTRAGRGAAP